MAITPEIYATVRAESARNGVDPAVVLALIESESNFNPSAVNPHDPSYGLMQIMPATARQVMGDPTITAEKLMDPDFNIEVGVKYLSELLDSHGQDIIGAVTVYKGAKKHLAVVSKMTDRIDYWEDYVLNQEQQMPTNTTAGSDITSSISDIIKSFFINPDGTPDWLKIGISTAVFIFLLKAVKK